MNIYIYFNWSYNIYLIYYICITIFSPNKLISESSVDVIAMQVFNIYKILKLK